MCPDNPPIEPVEWGTLAAIAARPRPHRTLPTEPKKMESVCQQLILPSSGASPNSDAGQRQKSHAPACRCECPYVVPLPSIRTN